MQNLAFTHLNLFDVQQDATLLAKVEKRRKATEGTIAQIAPSSALEIPSNYRIIDLSGKPTKKRKH